MSVGGAALLRNGIALRQGQPARRRDVVKRRIGPKRARSTSQGLTKAQAERELRRLIESMTVVPKVMDIAEAGKCWLAHLEAVGRRTSTLMDYESAVRIHLVPFFGSRPIGKIVAADVERFMVVKRGEGRSAKSVRNWLGVLHSLLSYAEKRDWIASNPCRKVDFPRIEETDADIRFLAPEGVEALAHMNNLESVLTYGALAPRRAAEAISTATTASR
jgi:hypothetical protein